MTVVSGETKLSHKEIMVSPMAASSAPVGSPAKIRVGFLNNSLAITILYAWPLDHSSIFDVK